MTFETALEDVVVYTLCSVNMQILPRYLTLSKCVGEEHCERLFATLPRHSLLDPLSAIERILTKDAELQRPEAEYLWKMLAMEGKDENSARCSYVQS